MMVSRHIDNQKGVALVMTLVISAIALAIMGALVYMLSAGTQISGMQKRYRTAVEAGEGGQSIMFDFISDRGTPGWESDFAGISLALSAFSNSVYMDDKLNKSTADWDPDCDRSMAIDITNATTYDIGFSLGGYDVYTKIVNTVEGNSGASPGLVKTGVVSSNSGEIPVQSFPYVYTMEIDSRNHSNPDEKARLSVLYQY